MEYTNHLRALMETHGDAAKARQMKQYMRNQYEFFGLKAPERRKLLSAFFKEYGYPENVPMVCEAWWNKPEREFQHCAMELMEKRKKKSDISWIKTYEYMVTHKSWWDTVDFISAKLMGYHFKVWPKLIGHYIPRWMDSGNIWLQRSCLLFQLKYKDETDWELMRSLIIRLKHSDEFFIRKAIGWVLREYSKTHPCRVARFVESAGLKGLSRREALKVIG